MQNDCIEILDNVHIISQCVLLSQYGHILQTRVLLSIACVLFPVLAMKFIIPFYFIWSNKNTVKTQKTR